MSRYYDRDGRPLALMEWALLVESDKDLAYRRVALTDLPGTDGYVSTVWLGLDHNFVGDGPPLIFETMIRCPGLEEFCERSSTVESARLVHQVAVEHAIIELGMMDDE